MTDFPTAPPPSSRLLIFARLPERGRVKARLAAEVGEERALEAYEAMLRDALGSIGRPSDDCEFEVTWAPSESAGGEQLARAFAPFPVAMQTGPDLGVRMAMAFSERFFFHRTRKIIAVGVDDPTLPRELLDHAFALLDSCDWVIGPALDGGYYLIGCRATAFDAEAFAGIDWGTSTVFQTTLGKLRAAGHNIAVLPARRDLDTADDLRHFARERHQGALAELLRRWGW